MFASAFEAISNPASLARQLLSGFITFFVASQVYLLCLHASLRSTAVLNRLDQLALDLGLSNSTFLLATCLLLAFLAILANRTIYRLSEGYVLRRCLLWFEHRHRIRVERLQNEAIIAGGGSWSDLSWTQLDRQPLSRLDSGTLKVFGDLSWRSIESFPPNWWPLGTSRHLNDYPDDISWVLPTRFGNIIRAAETYGYTQFHLDLLTFWEELVSLVPKETVQGYEQAKITTDVLVNLRLVAIGFTTVFAADGMFGHRSIWSSIGGVAGSLAVALAVGRAAEHSARSWQPPLRAIVHLGRRPLAASLGLAIPKSIQNERRMWERLTGSVQYRSSGWWEMHDKDRTRRIPRVE